MNGQGWNTLNSQNYLEKEKQSWRHHASWFQTIKETLIKILWLLFKSLSLDCSVVQLRPIFCDPMDCSMPGFPFLHYFLEFAQTHIYWVSDVIQPSHPLSPLVLLPSIFPSMRVFSSESALCIRWPKSWSFSFSISPSNEYFVIVQLLSRVRLFVTHGLQHARLPCPLPSPRVCSNSCPLSP